MGNNKKKVTGIIRVYSRKARDQIVGIGSEFFNEAGIADCAEDVFACVDELIKNAVKANYKFLLIMDRIQEDLIRDNPGRDADDIKRQTYDIIKDKKMFDRIASRIVSSEEISQTVREILNQESQQLSIKNRSYDEHRAVTAEERASIGTLDKLTRIRTEMKERDIKILLKIEYDGDFIYIEVTNTAPIMTQDMNRIHEKRDEYRQYRMEGREYEFFINNIDTSDSGFGLGYAKIDSFLTSMGLDADRSISIISANNTTVMLSIPVSALRERMG
ncbi:MAG TPA: hypothetical protein PL088_08030 [Spirochaetota bacterium]|nr:hypothetical protein [Spirochaetota bacterium]